MPGTRSVYFDPESEAIVRKFQATTHHKFSRSVCLIIIEFNKQQKAIIQLREDIELIKIQLVKKID